MDLPDKLEAVAQILDRIEANAAREGKPYEWSPAAIVREAITELED